MRVQRKVFFVVNPCSANGSTRRWWMNFLPELDRSKLEYDWAFTDGPYSAPAIAEEAVSKGYNIIGAVGGDGTAYETANGLFESRKPASSEISLALIPRGTGCDIARTLNIPRDSLGMIRLLETGRPVPVDAGWAEFLSFQGKKTSRCFLNVAEAGLGAETVARVNRTTKVFGGFCSFLWGTMVSLGLYRSRQMRVIIDDNIVREGKFTLVACGNGKYFGGGMKICPGALVDDGWLEVIGIEEMSKVYLAANLFKVYQGSHISIPGVWQCRAKKVSIQSDEQVLVNLDGEQPGLVQAEFSVLPGALRLLL